MSCAGSKDFKPIIRPSNAGLKETLLTEMPESKPQISGVPEPSGILHRHSRIYLAGHRGMVGAAIHRRLRAENYDNILTRTHAQLDLVDQAAVRDFFENEKIDVVILAAAKVGGIHANNTYPAEFIYENIMIQANVIHAAYRSGVERLLFLGSSCIYPKFARQPMREEQLLTGVLEPTNEPYAIAKIAGIELCESYNRQYGTHYRSLMPTNLYGPRDNFDLENSHVLPAMVRKFHLAKLALRGEWGKIQKDEASFGAIPSEFQRGLKAISRYKNRESRSPSTIELWGSGRPRREFLHVDDLASACLFVCNLRDDVYAAACSESFAEQIRAPHKLQSASPPSDLTDCNRVFHINVGSGKDIRIAELAQTVREVVGYQGAVSWNSAMPDGTPRKLLDISRLKQLGWQPRIGLREGIKSTYAWYLAQSELD